MSFRRNRVFNVHSSTGMYEYGKLLIAYGHKKAMLRIRIHMFLGLLNPDPLVRGMDPDPSITKQK